METKIVETKIIDLKKIICEDDVDSKCLAEVLSPAAEILKANGTVAFPTETVYGLGANALDETAISKIYTAKGRPSDNPLIAHIANIEMLDDLVSSVSDMAKKLMDAFWPGPMTLIFQKKESVPNGLTAGLDTVAVRMPSHEVAKTIIELSGLPIAAPSANLSGKPSPTDGAHVIADLSGRVDCIVVGDATEVGLESTVIDTTGEVPLILRPGAITQEMVIEVVGGCEVDSALISKDQNIVPKAPGMKYKHYAPDAEVHVLIGDKVKIIQAFELEIQRAIEMKYRLGILLFEEDLCVLEKVVSKGVLESEWVVIFEQGSVKEPEIFARQLFRDLRESDQRKCQKVFVHGIETTGIGNAIMNRLLKAAEGSVTRI